jgi:hypothetical protein
MNTPKCPRCGYQPSPNPITPPLPPERRAKLETDLQFLQGELAKLAAKRLELDQRQHDLYQFIETIEAQLGDQ